ncbi:hypothetical protein JCM10296v2_007358 [Rhodotorula toruloides]
MDALRSPPPSASSFTFPPSPAHASTSSPSSSSKLAAAFDYPVRQDSLAHARGAHHPSTSTSTASSSSSRGRGHAYASTGSSSAGTRSAYTSCTSDAFDEGEDCEDEDEGRDYTDAGSVLDELYDELAAFHPLAGKDAEASPPRGYGRFDSTALLRERTRYRSSASYSPTQALNLQRSLLPGAFGTLSFEQRDSQLSLLASIAASPSTPLDRCFCGNEAEEDSIYCGRACAQADALNALCGAGSGAGSSGVEEGAASSSSSSDGASLRSGTSGGMVESGSESHYRRVEKEAERRAKERERQIRREKKAGRKLGRSEAAARLEGRAQEEEEERVMRPPPRTTSRPSCERTSSRTGAGTPSLSSSISSLASSALPSPISPCFPSTTAAPNPPFIVEPTTSCAFEPPLRPCTPNPPHLPNANDIYSSYLTATPLASDKLRTPRGTGTPASTLVTPRATFPRTPGAEDDEEDESPTQRCGGGGGAEGVGLRMLELCADDDEGLEERDQVSPDPDEGDWGARDMRERMWARSGSARSSTYGHTKGKLSFEDVVGILGA